MKTLPLVALAIIGVGAAYYLRKQLQVGTSPGTARGVTDSTKGGLTTTTIQTGRVAAVGIGDPLKWIGSVTNRAAQLIPNNLSNGSYAGNWRIPFGNAESPAAASGSVKATNVSNYRPSAWAPISFRQGV